MTDKERQDLVTRIGAMHFVAEALIVALQDAAGDAADATLRSIRDDLVQRFKQAEVPAERDLDHANLTRPAIEVIEALFDGRIRS